MIHKKIRSEKVGVELRGQMVLDQVHGPVNDVNVRTCKLRLDGVLGSLVDALYPVVDVLGADVPLEDPLLKAPGVVGAEVGDLTLETSTGDPEKRVGMNSLTGH